MYGIHVCWYMHIEYCKFIAIETFDIVTKIQGFRGNPTTTSRLVNTKDWLLWKYLNF